MLTRLDILLFINFFLLSFALLTVYYFAYRYRQELRASHELRRLAERYMALFDSAGAGVFQVDLNGKFLLINQAGAMILGFDGPEQVLQKKLDLAGIGIDHETQAHMFKTTIRHSLLENFELALPLHKEALTHLEITLHTRTAENGEITGFDGIFRDVTVRINMQEELRTYSTNLEIKIEEKTREVLELERTRFHLEKLASLGQMAAMIVHDIRNPLSSIKMGLTTLLTRAELRERDKYCIEIAIREVMHLERILHDLLNFAKPQELRLSDQDINRIIDLALDQLAEDFEDTGIVINREMSPDLPFLRVDTDRLSQVFVNLLINAKQAINGKGIITIRTGEKQEDNRVQIEIEDNGCGITEEDAKRIFDPFFSTKAEGTGLGLSVVQKLIEAHNGTVRLESEYGSGTTVIMELPYREVTE